MKYGYVVEEWDLEPGEVDKAQFILQSWSHHNSQDKAGTPVSNAQKGALARFQGDFYLAVQSRLKDDSYYWSLSLNKDGTKLQGIRVTGIRVTEVG